ncbi:glycoside hydrolase family 2 [Saccharopolyspora karakumensis]|uniref:Glycoside hydrolase family 2 n=1 Tax=Saccharopolyspora karakumensis TaxID=2530386 RepID=A0A4R5BKU5_9PSEU|nr:sugar-binding domain-containing protein [Saccharopolyspora karakumensis]TDD84474.1 glycoside hydrolase family 2 [Saccharopolyspora karakumensis]
MAAPEPAWQPEAPPLTTPWTDQVGPDNALPEYPRPQLTRERWLNLNGLWDYTGGDNATEQILVPYPPESGLSGVQRHDDQMLYERTFDVPADWSGQRLILHFGAVDQRAEVSVNGKQVAVHEGGYTAFSADITDAVTPGAPQRLTVAVSDGNETQPYPVGKQRNDPGGILYTGASGIWQTVWLEPVAPAHITGLDITPDLTGFGLTADAAAGNGEQVEIAVRDAEGNEVTRTSGPAREPVRVDVPQPHLWTPDDPYLYDLTVRLLGAGGAVLDEVGSYTGLRTTGLVNDEQGRPRMALNGKIVFQHGPLDQGYWPDGIYTAPTDEALRFDLDKTKELGFNMVRKHVKVEPARWYYWADKLGLMVWQDMPSLPIDLAIPPEESPPPTEEMEANYRSEWVDIIDQLRSSTSIVAWVPFNEGWGEFDTAEITDLTRRTDPTRLINPSSGVNCCYSLPDSGAGDIYDDHTYVGPGAPTVKDGRAIVDGEYGGLGLAEEGHLWPGEPSAYEMTESREQLTQRYGEVSDELARIIGANGLSAAIYTQTTDVENEVNGFLTYDRQIMKPDVASVRAHNTAAIEAGSR